MINWKLVLQDTRLTPEDRLIAGIRTTRLDEQAREAAAACTAAQFYLLYQVGAAARSELAEAYRNLVGVRRYFGDNRGRKALVFRGGSLVLFGTPRGTGSATVAIYTSGRQYRRDLLRAGKEVEPGSLEDRLLRYFRPRRGPGSGGRRAGAGRPPKKGELRQNICVSLPPPLLRQIDARAKEEGVSRSQVVLDLLSAP